MRRFVVYGVVGGRRLVRVENPADLFGGEEIELETETGFAVALRLLALQIDREVPAWVIASFTFHILLPAEDEFSMSGEQLDEWIDAAIARARAGRRRSSPRTNRMKSALARAEKRRMILGI